MAIQVRRGNEADFDPSKMLPGEWAVSTDTKYVRMCFAPGIVLRMATYESFENDVKKIQQILEDAENIKNAIEVIQDEINAKEIVVENYSKQASSFAAQSKKYSEESEEYSIDSYEQAERAKMYADNAQAVTNVSIASKKKAGIVRGGDNLIGEDGELILTRTTTDRTLSHSHAGGLRIESVEGESVQESTTGAQLFNGTLQVGIKDSIDGNLTLTTGVYQTIDFAVDTEGEYTFSFGIPVLIARRDGEILNASGNVFTYILEAGLHYISFRNADSTTWDNSVEIMLNAGDTALPCEPYTGRQPSPSPSYPQEIESSVVSEIKVSCAQLYDAKKLTNAYVSVDEDGWITLECDNTARDTVFYVNFNVPPNALLKPNAKYLIVLEVAAISNMSTIHACSVAESNSYKGQFASGVSASEVGIVTSIVSTISDFENSITMLRTFATVKAGMIGTAKFRISVIEDISITADTFKYIPYTETTIALSTPITLHGTGEAKDRIVKQDGVWGVKRKPQYDVYTSISSIVNGLAQIIVPSNHFESLSWDKVPNALCNMFKAVSYNDNKAGIEGFSTKSTSDANNWAYTFFIPSIEQTVEAYNAFLVEKPIEFVSVKGESTFEPLPEADQIALNSLVTYDEVTYICTDSTIEPVVTVTYGTSKVGAEGILNANALEISELEKAKLLKEIEQLKNNNNIITYSSLEEIPDYTDGIGWKDVIEILPPNSMVQTGYVVTKYPNLFDNAPDVVKLCTGILFINKAHDYSNYLIKVYDADLQKIYLRGAYPEWTEISGNEIK